MKICSVHVMSVACGLIGATAAVAAPVSFDFEAPAYTAGTGLSGQDGWAGGAAKRVLTGQQIADELVAAGLQAGVTTGSGSQALLISSITGTNSTSTRVVNGFESESHVVLRLFPTLSQKFKVACQKHIFVFSVIILNILVLHIVIIKINQ